MDETPLTKIASGLVRGVPSAFNKKVTVYKGLPYAASPAGENRWRAPQPVTPWEGVRVADTFGPVCPQLPFWGQPEQNEDCLTVNVWTPESSIESKFPVFVWIYGGRFTSGAGSDPQFDGTGLAEKGLVVVTFNYRLGILGWLATPELSAESGHNSSGNYGLLDQVAALKWVKDNIAAFGGDPNEVTVGGQSAGGASTGLHVLSPLSRGLFHRAINESGFRYPRDPLLSGLAPAYRLKDRAEHQGQEIMKTKGATNISELRKMDLKTLLEGNNNNDSDLWGTPPIYRPCLDGYVFPYNFEESLQRGALADIPIMTGHNADEGGTYLDPEFSVDDLKACAQQKYGELSDRFLELYPVTESTTALQAWNEAARDNSRVTVAMWANEFHKHASSPVYGYYFTQAPPAKVVAPSKESKAVSQPTPFPANKTPRTVYTYLKNAPGVPRGSYHSAEIPYAFNNLDAQEGYQWSEADRSVAEAMSTYWSNFIKYGNPSGEGVTDFVRTEGEKIMKLGEQICATPLAETPERIAFWKEHLMRQKPF